MGRHAESTRSLKLQVLKEKKNDEAWKSFLLCVVEAEACRVTSSFVLYSVLRMTQVATSLSEKLV